MTDATYPYALSTEITGSGLVYTGKGTLSGIVVGSHTNGTVKIYDGLTSAGTVLVNTYTFASGSSVLDFMGIKFNTGLYITTGGTLDITVVYTPYVG